MGCGIDLDDFGTGHTAIANLRRFAVRRLKIDRSFVTRVDESREQQQMIAAILSLAERLGLDTLAEGVETAGEQAMLAQLGCGHLQGYAIARPMPLEETEAWLRRHAARVAVTARLPAGRGRSGA
jgi:EAL domain-containing protein (putative c-di-GMP-specific phosphodiesterase class I)